MLFEQHQNVHIEVVKLLTRSGVDPTAIRLVAHHGYVEVELLRKSQSITTLVASDQLGHIEVVKLLLTYPGVDPTEDNNYALQIASENGHIEVVKLLLTCPGVDPTRLQTLLACAYVLILLLDTTMLFDWHPEKVTLKL